MSSLIKKDSSKHREDSSQNSVIGGQRVSFLSEDTQTKGNIDQRKSFQEYEKKIAENPYGALPPPEVLHCSQIFYNIYLESIPSTAR
jgi:hypothetical protein